MVYCSTGSLERLFFHPNNNLEERHWVDLEMSNCGATFSVTMCCDDEWVWEFYYTSKTDYERVKMCIIDMLYECNNMYELMSLLDEVFLEVFEDMLVEDEEVECCGNCLC